jgi:phosphoglycerate dehydrogenase-like enzyme
LATGKLGAAGLDVFEEEPVSLDSPLLKLENTAFSPHLGTSVMETRVRMATTAAEDVIRVLREQAPLYSLLRRAS